MKNKLKLKNMENVKIDNENVTIIENNTENINQGAQTMKNKVNCKDCRCFVNFCRIYRKYTDNCPDFIDDKKI